MQLKSVLILFFQKQKIQANYKNKYNQLKQMRLYSNLQSNSKIILWLIPYIPSILTFTQVSWEYIIAKNGSIFQSEATPSLKYLIQTGFYSRYGILKYRVYISHNYLEYT